MNRKYLDDIGAVSRWDNNWGNYEPDSREERWREQREIYGFDDRETWDLKHAFYLWLYERLKMYVDIGGEVINLDFHTFTYEGKEYTQRELINIMLERLEYSFNPDYDDWDEEQSKYVSEIEKIWAIVLPAMWW